MARKTDGEKVDELEKLVAGILVSLGNVERAIAALDSAHRESTQDLNDLRREYEKEIAVLKKEIEELRRWAETNGTSDLRADMGVLKEKTSRVEAVQEKVAGRAWSIVPNVVGAIVNALLAATVAYLVAKR